MNQAGKTITGSVLHEIKLWASIRYVINSLFLLIFLVIKNDSLRCVCLRLKLWKTITGSIGEIRRRM